MTNVRRMSALIDDTLDFARARLGSASACKSPRSTTSSARCWPWQANCRIRTGTLDRLQRFDRAHDPLRSGPHPAVRVEPAVERASAWFELASGIFFRPHRRYRSGDPGRQPRNADSAGKPRTHLRAVLAPLDVREPRRPRSRAAHLRANRPRLRRPPRRRLDGGFRHALHRANSAARHARCGLIARTMAHGNSERKRNGMTFASSGGRNARTGGR